MLYLVKKTDNSTAYFQIAQGKSALRGEYLFHIHAFYLAIGFTNITELNPKIAKVKGKENIYFTTKRSVFLKYDL